LSLNQKAKREALKAQANDFEALFNTGLHSDLVIAIVDVPEEEETIDENDHKKSKKREVKEFHVHKLILAARSPVFAAMFAHSELVEMTNGRVEITDFDAEMFGEFLRFLYSGQVDAKKLEKWAEELLRVADKVKVKMPLNYANVCTS